MLPDRFSKEVRSKIMSKIRGKDTTPEMVIRKILWSKGKRYRIHNKRILGSPDISNKRLRVAVFIDGCFWHGCHTCYREPKSNIRFWRNKIHANQKRRLLVRRNLRMDGWNVLEFWEHDIRRDPDNIVDTILKSCRW